MILLIALAELTFSTDFLLAIKLIFVQSTSFLKLKSRCNLDYPLFNYCIIHIRGISFYFKSRNEHSYMALQRISNGNRTEWSPIRSVIIRVINKIGRPRSGSPICLITSMITDRIGRHEVLLPINHNFNKICNIIGYFLNQNTRNSTFCFASREKRKPFKRARDGAYCSIT